MPQQAIDGVGGAVSLELVERLPNLRVVEVNVLQQAIAFATFRQPFFKDVVERLVVNELRRVGRAQASQRSQHLLLGVAGELCVRPKGVEPVLKCVALVRIADLRVQFDVRNAAESQPSFGEVGAAQQRGAGAVRAGDVIELAVKEVRPVDGADFHQALDPSRTRLGERLLRQHVLKLDAAIVREPERLGLIVDRINRTDALWIAVKKSDASCGFQRVPKGLVGVDGEVGRYERQLRSRGDRILQHIADPSGSVVVDDRSAWRRGIAVR